MLDKKDLEHLAMSDHEIRLIGLPEDLHKKAIQAHKDHKYTYTDSICSCGRQLDRFYDSETDEFGVYCIEVARFDWSEDIDPYERLTMPEDELRAYYKNHYEKAGLKLI